MGTPTQSDWPEGYKLASKIGFTFPKFVKTDLTTLIPNAPPEAIDIMNQMMEFDASKRPTAQQLMSHDYFKGYSAPVQNSVDPRASNQASSK